MAFDAGAFGQAAAGSAANFGMNLLGNAVSGLINNAFYRRNLDLQVKAQKELIDYQNEYNSPTAQMQRLSEAGLNPNLVYGSAAPAGISGNASAPSGVANAGVSFNTPDVVASALRIQQMENVEADAELKKAQAEYLRTQNAWFPQTASTNIMEAQTRMSEMASRMELNDSTIQYQTALKSLADADEAYKRGQISLQTYEKEVLIAQSQLFKSDKSLKDAQKGYFTSLGENMRLQNKIMEIEFKYKQIVQSPLMAEKEKEARIQALKTQTAKDAVNYGFEGNNAIRWTDFIFNKVEQSSRIFKNFVQ